MHPTNFPACEPGDIPGDMHPIRCDMCTPLELRNGHLCYFCFNTMVRWVTDEQEAAEARERDAATAAAAATTTATATTTEKEPGEGISAVNTGEASGAKNADSANVAGANADVANVSGANAGNASSGSAGDGSKAPMKE